MVRGDILIAGQRVADQDRVALVGVKRAVGFIGKIDRRKFRPAVEPYRPQQAYLPIQTETLIPLHPCCLISGGA
jgi:hypothetical protein